MSKRISILVALEGADEGLKRAITSAERSLGELSTSAKTAGAKAAAGLAEVKAGMSAFGDQVATAKTQLLAFLSINWAGGPADSVGHAGPSQLVMIRSDLKSQGANCSIFKLI